MHEYDAPTSRLNFGRKRLPVILQAEASECGVACLAMIAAYFGHQTTLVEMRRRFSTSLKGATLKALMDMADALGLTARPLRLELNELRSLKTPAILHWDLKHYVVLERVRGGRVTIHDPARGNRTLPLSDVGRSFTGVALEFTSTPAFERRTQVERVRLGDFFSRARGLVGSMTQLLLLAAVMQAFALLSPMLNQLIVDDAINKGDLDLLTTIGIGMALLLVVTQAVTLLRGYISLYMGTQLSFQMQTNILRHVFRLPVSWFEKRHIGDILSRFGSLSPVQSTLTSAVPALVLDGVMFAFALTMMVLYSPLLSAIEMGTVLFFFSVRLGTYPYLRQKTDQGLQLSARVQTTLIETLRGARTFKIFGRERERVAVWQNEQAQQVNNSVQVARFGLWGGLGTGLLSGAQQIIVWWLGARMVIQGQLSLGMLLAYQAYVGQFGSATSDIVSQFFTFRTLGLHLERLADVVHADVESGIDMPSEPGRVLKGGIKVRNLSFRYAEQEPWVIRDSSFTAEPGELVCFTGPSGQGKSTLMKLLLGFYEPQEGEILIDDVPLRSFGMRTFRDRVGVVMQDDHLFTGTISDNISLFSPDVDQVLVEAAARSAQIHEEIMTLPMGYMSMVGDLGSTLSGGQRQRVLLARALYRRPSILFLDEGTANLDQDSEKRVMDTIRSLPITRVVVAHRTESQEGASQLLTVRAGKIAGSLGAQGGVDRSC